jgi:gluconolactonase
VKFDAENKETIIAENQTGNDLVVAKNGNIYFTAPDGREKPSKLFLIKPTGEKVELDNGLIFANGITLSPDQTQLYVTESMTHWVWAYQIQTDGTLSHKQKFGWLHTRDKEDFAWGDGIKCDQDGRIYVATRSGIQVLDQLGRVNAIIPVPTGISSNLCFGGKDFDTLYVSCVDKVYRRKVKTHGANTFDMPLKPKSSGL